MPKWLTNIVDEILVWSVRNHPIPPYAHMKTLAQAVADAAESKAGVRESGGANKGAELQPFFAADHYKPNADDDGYPWCAAFVCWCVQVAVAGRFITFKRPTTPSAYGLETWSLAQDKSTWTKRHPGSDIERGDIVTFDKFSHVGIAIGPPGAGGYFPTVEGNTNEAGSREGDGVYRKTRHISQIRARIRFTK